MEGIQLTAIARRTAALAFVLLGTGGCAFRMPPPPSVPVTRGGDSSGLQATAISEPRPVFLKTGPAERDIETLVEDVVEPAPAEAPTRPVVEVRRPDSPIARVTSTPAVERASPGECLDDLVIDLLEELGEISGKTTGNGDPGEFARIRRAELEKRLIALFLASEHPRLEQYRELLESLNAEASPVLTLEILKAAFYQELGLVERRDRVLAEIGTTRVQVDRSFRVKSWNVASRSRRSGRGDGSARPVLRAGEEIDVSGELENFESTTVTAFGGISRKYRRSFSASISLLGLDGALVERSPILLPGKATELTEAPDPSVRFWGRFRLPNTLPAGPYMLELVVVDLEGKAVTAAHREIEVR